MTTPNQPKTASGAPEVAGPCCERCGKGLVISEIVWLERNTRNGRYYHPGTVPLIDSQGVFPFGKDCAREVIEMIYEGGQRARPKKESQMTQQPEVAALKALESIKPAGCGPRAWEGIQTALALLKATKATQPDKGQGAPQVTAAYSPLPWHTCAGITDSDCATYIKSSDGQIVARIDGYSSAIDEADAALIRRAVNAHADLLAALEACVSRFQHEGEKFVKAASVLDQARAAIAKAKA